MAPCSNNDCEQRKKSKIWWQTTGTKQRVLSYYNKIIAKPSGMDQPIVLTRPALHALYYYVMDNKFFPEQNHFTTHNRYFISRGGNIGDIICTTCHYCIPDRSAIKFEAKIHGNEYLVLPDTLIYTIVSMPALWCSICQMCLFEWYDNFEYSQLKSI